MKYETSHQWRVPAIQLSADLAFVAPQTSSVKSELLTIQSDLETKSSIVPVAGFSKPRARRPESACFIHCRTPGRLPAAQ